MSNNLFITQTIVYHDSKNNLSKTLEINDMEKPSNGFFCIFVFRSN